MSNIILVLISLFIFVDICMASDLEAVFSKFLKDFPSRAVIVVPEWKERLFWEVSQGISGEFLEVPANNDSIQEKTPPETSF